LNRSVCGDKFLQLAGCFLAAGRAFRQIFLLSSRQRLGVCLAEIPAGAAVELRHGRHQLSFMWPVMSKRQSLGDRQSGVMPGKSFLGGC
jgi:hypothetical protein